MDDVPVPLSAEIDGETIQAILHRHSQDHPSLVALTFLTFNDGNMQGRSVSYAELQARSLGVATLLATKMAPGDRAILAFPPGLDFVAAFFGCLFAGIVAVPVAIPRPNRPSHLHAIVRDCDAKALVCAQGSSFADAISAELRLPLIPLSPDCAGPGPAPDGQRRGHQEIAFLQYTSGSTASPKGVIVTHRGLMANLAQIRSAFHHDTSTVGVNWLPHYHDMGLIGTLLQPIYARFHSVLMSPTTFVQQPFLWLKAIEHFRGTTCGGPAFGYRHCIDRVESDLRSRVDLSSWEVAYCGAEPIQASTLRQFASAFGGAGFRSTSLFPCYGLAEATLLVTATRHAAGMTTAWFEIDALEHGRAVASTRDTPSAREIVSCGVAPEGTTVAITDETGRHLESGLVGEIRVSGPAISPGYWNEKDAHERVRSLATGDLGFIHEGQLFITGRMKDLIIIDGRNIAPQDLEWTACRCHPALTAAAAFAVQVDGQERVVLLAEIAGGLAPAQVAAAEASVRDAIGREYDVPLLDLKAVKTLSLPRTTSGKISRSGCRRAYENRLISLAGGHD